MLPAKLPRRICVIAEEEETKLKRLSELKASLRKQKYPIALIEKSMEKGREKIIPFVSTHNPNNPNINQS